MKFVRVVRAILPKCWASTEKAKRELGWQAKLSLADMTAILTFRRLAIK